jgi:hypothetical protein
VSPVVRYVQLVIFTLAGVLAGVVIGLLFGRFRADWVEAVGTWFSGFVALFAVILAWIAFKSEEFTRVRQYLRQMEDADEARRVERARLQSEADLIECGAALAKGEKAESGAVLVQEIVFFIQNNSEHVVTRVNCRVQLLGIDSIEMPDALPRRQAPKQIPVSPFKTDENFREVSESAEFTFTLGDVRWSKRPERSAIRLNDYVR